MDNPELYCVDCGMLSEECMCEEEYDEPYYNDDDFIFPDYQELEAF